MNQDSIHESIIQVLDSEISDAEYEKSTHRYVFRTEDKREMVIYGEIMSRTSDPVKKEIEAKLGIMLSALRSFGSWAPGKDEVLPHIEAD